MKKAAILLNKHFKLSDFGFKKLQFFTRKYCGLCQYILHDWQVKPGIFDGIFHYIKLVCGSSLYKKYGADQFGIIEYSTVLTRP
jgi:hypothetical protein